MGMSKPADDKEFAPSSTVGEPADGAQGPADVGTNLRQLRKQQGHSLDALARLSGVSRAMLGQIETGKSIPTVTLVWKIASALGVSAAALIASPKRARAVVLPKSGARLITCSEGRYILRAFASPEIVQGIKFYELRIAPGHRELVNAYGPGTCISFAVATGSIEVGIGETEPVQLAEGDGILFEADVVQSYFNPSAVTATAYLVIGPSRNRGRFGDVDGDTLSCEANPIL